MNRSHPALWAFGWAGLASGVLMATIGIVGAGDIASLAGGYGVLVMGAALYLLAGLKLRARLAGRAAGTATAPSRS